MDNEAEIWVLLWSHRQNCLHIEPVHLMYQRNREKFSADTPGDYVPVLIGCRGEIDLAAQSLRQVIRSRDVARQHVNGLEAA